MLLNARGEDIIARQAFMMIKIKLREKTVSEVTDSIIVTETNAKVCNKASI